MVDRCVPACLPTCLAACLLVGTSTGSWTKRELPLASSLYQLSALRRASAKGIEYLPFSTVFPSFSYLSYLSSLALHSPHRSLIRYRSKEEESGGLWICGSCQESHLANKPRNSRCVRSWGGRKDFVSYLYLVIFFNDRSVRISKNRIGILESIFSCRKPQRRLHHWLKPYILPTHLRV